MSFSFNSNSDTYYMFRNCESLETILYDKQIVSGESTDMFSNAKSLRHYNESGQAHDATFAYPDDGVFGFLTDPHPTVTLTPFVGGHYEDAGGKTITSIAGD